MAPYKFNKEAQIRYEHYRKNLFEQYMAPARERRKRLHAKGFNPIMIPSISGAVWTSQVQAKKEAKKMVKWDKKMARLNKMKLRDFPRTEWAVTDV